MRLDIAAEVITSCQDLQNVDMENEDETLENIARSSYYSNDLETVHQETTSEAEKLIQPDIPQNDKSCIKLWRTAEYDLKNMLEILLNNEPISSADIKCALGFLEISWQASYGDKWWRMLLGERQANWTDAGNLTVKIPLYARLCIVFAYENGQKKLVLDSIQKKDIPSIERFFEPVEFGCAHDLSLAIGYCFFTNTREINIPENIERILQNIFKKKYSVLTNSSHDGFFISKESDYLFAQQRAIRALKLVVEKGYQLRETTLDLMRCFYRVPSEKPENFLEELGGSTSWGGKIARVFLKNVNLILNKQNFISITHPEIKCLLKAMASGVQLSNFSESLKNKINIRFQETQDKEMSVEEKIELTCLFMSLLQDGNEQDESNFHKAEETFEYAINWISNDSKKGTMSIEKLETRNYVFFSLYKLKKSAPDFYKKISYLLNSIFDEMRGDVVELLTAVLLQSRSTQKKLPVLSQEDINDISSTLSSYSQSAKCFAVKFFNVLKKYQFADYAALYIPSVNVGLRDVKNNAERIDIVNYYCNLAQQHEIITEDIFFDLCKIVQEAEKSDSPILHKIACNAIACAIRNTLDKKILNMYSFPFDIIKTVQNCQKKDIMNHNYLSLELQIMRGGCFQPEVYLPYIDKFALDSFTSLFINQFLLPQTFRYILAIFEHYILSGHVLTAFSLSGCIRVYTNNKEFNKESELLKHLFFIINFHAKNKDVKEISHDVFLFVSHSLDGEDKELIAAICEFLRHNRDRVIPEWVLIQLLQDAIKSKDSLHILVAIDYILPNQKNTLSKNVIEILCSILENHDEKRECLYAAKIIERIANKYADHDPVPNNFLKTICSALINHEKYLQDTVNYCVCILGICKEKNIIKNDSCTIDDPLCEAMVKLFNNNDKVDRGSIYKILEAKPLYIEKLSLKKIKSDIDFGSHVVQKAVICVIKLYIYFLQRKKECSLYVDQFLLILEHRAVTLSNNKLLKKIMNIFETVPNKLSMLSIDSCVQRVIQSSVSKLRKSALRILKAMQKDGIKNLPQSVTRILAMEDKVRELTSSTAEACIQEIYALMQNDQEMVLTVNAFEKIATILYLNDEEKKKILIIIELALKRNQAIPVNITEKLSSFLKFSMSFNYNVKCAEVLIAIFSNDQNPLPAKHVLQNIQEECVKFFPEKNQPMQDEQEIFIKLIEVLAIRGLDLSFIADEIIRLFSRNNISSLGSDRLLSVMIRILRKEQNNQIASTEQLHSIINLICTRRYDLERGVIDKESAGVLFLLLDCAPELFKQSLLLKKIELDYFVVKSLDSAGVIHQLENIEPSYYLETTYSLMSDLLRKNTEITVLQPILSFITTVLWARLNTEKRMTFLNKVSESVIFLLSHLDADSPSYYYLICIFIQCIKKYNLGLRSHPDIISKKIKSSLYALYYIFSDNNSALLSDFDLYTLVHLFFETDLESHAAESRSVYIEILFNNFLKIENSAVSPEKTSSRENMVFFFEYVKSGKTFNHMTVLEILNCMLEERYQLLPQWIDGLADDFPYSDPSIDLLYKVFVGVNYSPSLDFFTALQERMVNEISKKSAWIRFLRYFIEKDICFNGQIPYFSEQALGELAAGVSAWKDNKNSAISKESQLILKYILRGDHSSKGKNKEVEELPWEKYVRIFILQKKLSPAQSECMCNIFFGWVERYPELRYRMEEFLEIFMMDNFFSFNIFFIPVDHIALYQDFVSFMKRALLYYSLHHITEMKYSIKKWDHPIFFEMLKSIQDNAIPLNLISAIARCIKKYELMSGFESFIKNEALSQPLISDFVQYYCNDLLLKKLTISLSDMVDALHFFSIKKTISDCQVLEKHADMIVNIFFGISKKNQYSPAVLKTFLLHAFPEKKEDEGNVEKEKINQFILFLSVIIHFKISTEKVHPGILTQILDAPYAGWLEEINIVANRLYFSDSNDSTTYEIFSLFNDQNPSNALNDQLRGFVEYVDTANANDYCSIYHPHHSISIPISGWAEEDIKRWAKYIVEKTNVSLEILVLSLEHLKEVLVVIHRAIFLCKSTTLRKVQFLAIICFLKASADHACSEATKGRLAQIATGEGKSLIIATLAIVFGLHKKKVDIVTSTPDLAERDCANFAPLYELFNLKCAHNMVPSYVNGLKNCYKNEINILYGSIHEFQFDILRDEFSKLGTRGKDRATQDCVVIADEADNVLYDRSLYLAMLSSSLPGYDYLFPIYAIIWRHINKIYGFILKWCDIFSDWNQDNPDKKTRQIEAALDDFETQVVDEILEKKYFNDENMTFLFIKENIEKYIKKDIEKPLKDSVFCIPVHLKKFVFIQLPKWIDSAYITFNRGLNVDYVISENISNMKSYIAPIDRLTGVTELNTHLSDGMTQFLELKENLPLTPETLTTNFISNLTFFTRYAFLLGMSGTLGSVDIREFLRRTYAVDTVIIPPHKKKQLYYYDPQVFVEETEWLRAILCGIEMEHKKHRPVLVICKSIQHVNQIKQLCDIRSIKCKLYARSDGDQIEVLMQYQDLDDVILTTNLGGRGTDFQLTTAAINKGGMHLILTDEALNERVTEQNIGRVARNGQPGTVQMIFTVSEFAAMGEGHKECYERIKVEQREKEMKRLEYIETEQFPIHKKKAVLFNTFCAILDSVEKPDTGNFFVNKRNAIKAELIRLQMIETWGIYLKSTHDINSLEASFSAFAAQIKQQPLNPCYALQYLNRLINYLYFFNVGKLTDRKYSFQEHYTEMLAICEQIKQIEDPLFLANAQALKGYLLLKDKPIDEKINARNCFYDARQKCKFNYMNFKRLQLNILEKNPNSLLHKQVANKLALIQSQMDNLHEIVTLIDRSRKLIHIRREDLSLQHFSDIDENISVSFSPRYSKSIKDIDKNEWALNLEKFLEKQDSAFLEIVFHDLRVYEDMYILKKNEVKNVVESLKDEASIRFHFKKCDKQKRDDIFIKNMKKISIIFHFSSMEKLIKNIESIFDAHKEKTNPVTLTFKMLSDDEMALAASKYKINLENKNKDKNKIFFKSSLSYLYKAKEEVKRIKQIINNDWLEISLEISELSNSDARELCAERNHVAVSILAQDAEHAKLLSEDFEKYFSKDSMLIVRFDADTARKWVKKIPFDVAFDQENIRKIEAISISENILSSDYKREMEHAAKNGFYFIFNIATRGPTPYIRLSCIMAIALAEIVSGVLTSFLLGHILHGLGITMGINLLALGIEDIFNIFDIAHAPEFDAKHYFKNKALAVITSLISAHFLQVIHMGHFVKVKTTAIQLYKKYMLIKNSHQAAQQFILSEIKHSTFGNVMSKCLEHCSAVLFDNILIPKKIKKLKNYLGNVIRKEMFNFVKDNHSKIFSIFAIQEVFGVNPEVALKKILSDINMNLGSYIETLKLNNISLVNLLDDLHYTDPLKKFIHVFLFKLIQERYKKNNFKSIFSELSLDSTPFRLHLIPNLEALRKDRENVLYVYRNQSDEIEARLAYSTFFVETIHIGRAVKDNAEQRKLIEGLVLLEEENMRLSHCSRENVSALIKSYSIFNKPYPERGVIITGILRKMQKHKIIDEYCYLFDACLLGSNSQGKEVLLDVNINNANSTLFFHCPRYSVENKNKYYTQIGQLESFIHQILIESTVKTVYNTFERTVAWTDFGINVLSGMAGESLISLSQHDTHSLQDTAELLLKNLTHSFFSSSHLSRKSTFKFSFFQPLSLKESIQINTAPSPVPDVEKDDCSIPAMPDDVSPLGDEGTESSVKIPGLRYQKIPGDGNCLYHAVGLYVEQKQDFLRNIVATYIKDHLEKYKNSIILRAGETINDYLRGIRTDAWATHIEIEALMCKLKRPIVVIELNGCMRTGMDLERFTGEPIFVLYNGATHYDSLLLDNTLSATAILQNLGYAPVSVKPPGGP